MATTDGFDLRERPWQPGLDDARFNQQPRNPNFTGGASPEAAAYQRANDLRGMSTAERPWTAADTKAFGTRPAGVAPTLGERARDVAGAARGRAADVGNILRDGYARTVGDTARFGPQPAAPAPGGLRGALGTATKWGGRVAGPAGALYEGAQNVLPVISDRDSTGVDVATQVAESGSKLATAGLGAAAGGAAGSVVPVVGTALGSIAGGLAGYYGGGKAISGLRDLFGVTPESPIDQVRARQTASLNAPGPAATAAPSGGGSGAVSPPSTQPTAAGPQPQPSTQGTPPTNNVLRNGNEYSGTNVAGDITINGRAPGGGISPQNMAAADALVGRDNLRSMGAAQASAAQMPTASAPVALHSGNSWQARNDLRNLEVAASSIANQRGMVTNDRGRVINPGVGDNGAREAYQAALKQDLAMRSAQPGLDLETNKSNNSLRSDILKAQTGADASRYAADQGLRGDIFKAQDAERTAARQAQRDAAAAAGAERKYTTERRDKSLERLDKVFETAATGRDGKVDAQHLAAMRNGAQAFLGTSIEAARKRGDTATVQQLESQGLSALAEDPQLMRRYTAALSADRAARGGWMPGENYVGTDNPGGRTVVGVDKGTFVDTARLSDGTTMNANRLRYRDGGPLSGINPWATPTTEFDSIDPKGYLRRPQQ